MSPAERAYWIAHGRRVAAEIVERDAFTLAFPPGATVSFETGDTVQTGTVLQLGHGQRLEVLNKRTGKVQWISAYRLVEV